MRIHYASDLHIDHTSLPRGMDIPYVGGVLLLAGDTFEVNSLKGYKKTLFDFERICKAFDVVYAITGNHEYYDNFIGLETTEDCYRTWTQHIPNFYLLQKEAVYLGEGITLAAATLWTDCNRGDPISKLQIEAYMNDFNCIKYSDKKVLTPDNTIEIHNEHLAFIAETVQESERCIVMTHHAPIYAHADTRRNLRNGDAYASQLDDFILDNTKKIPAWVHGHTHIKRVTRVGDTNVCSNARGYMNYSPLHWEFLDN